MDITGFFDQLLIINIEIPQLKSLHHAFIYWRKQSRLISCRSFNLLFVSADFF